jgi:hypothetical protein
MKLAFFLRDANEKCATDYPAAVGPHMSSTDSTEFMDHVPVISLRENERGMQIGAGWNPHYHQATDRFSHQSSSAGRTSRHDPSQRNRKQKGIVACISAILFNNRGVSRCVLRARLRRANANLGDRT